MSNCKKCNKPSIRGQEFCKEHFIEAEYEREEYLDNTDPENLGIIKWARRMVSEHVPNSTPNIHKEMLMLLFSLFDPFYKNKYERMHNYISFRGSAKSTLINFIFVLYLIVHNGKKMKIKGIRGEPIEVVIKENLIVIASETGMASEEFVNRIRDELTTNETLVWYYKANIEDAVDAFDGQWTKKAFKYNKCFVLGRGQGEQIRGKIKGASRPTLLICDDIYSENNTITENGRKAVRDWFENAAVKGVDDLRGKIVVVGTILHEDTVLIDNKRSKNWKTKEFPLMPIDKYQKFVRECLVVDKMRGTCFLPFDNDDKLDEFERKSRQRAHFKQLQDSYDWGLAWADRIDLYYLALQYQDHVQKRNVKGMEQEYFHVISSDEQKRIKGEYFIREQFTIYEKYGYVWFDCPTMFERPIPINVEIGIDMGTGTVDGDDSAIVIAGILPNGYRVIIDEISGKFGARDILHDRTSSNYGKVEFNREKIKEIGAFDEALRWCVQLKAKRLKLGYAGAEKKNVEELRQLAVMNRIYPLLVLGRLQERHEGQKAERIMNRIEKFYSTRTVIHKPGLDKLEYQLEYLTSSKYDDVADAVEVALYEMQPPYNIAVEDVLPPPTEVIRFKKTHPKKPPVFDWRQIN